MAERDIEAVDRAAITVDQIGDLLAVGDRTQDFGIVHRESSSGLLSAVAEHPLAHLVDHQHALTTRGGGLGCVA